MPTSSAWLIQTSPSVKARVRYSRKHNKSNKIIFFVFILERPNLSLLLINKEDKLSLSQKCVSGFPANKQALAVPAGRPSSLQQEPAVPGDGRQLLQPGPPGLSARPGCHLPTPPAKESFGNRSLPSPHPLHPLCWQPVRPVPLGWLQRVWGTTASIPPPPASHHSGRALSTHSHPSRLNK